MAVDLTSLNTGYTGTFPKIKLEKRSENKLSLKVVPSLFSKHVRTSLFSERGRPLNSSIEICESEFFKTLFKCDRERYLIQHTSYIVQ